MSSNTGLYEDSDDESLTNELSPTDGYFNSRPDHPQNVLVPDPSQASEETDKAREAREEEQASRASEASTAQSRQSQPQSPPQAATPRHRVDPTFEEEEPYTERSSLIPAAPPAYADATAGNPYRPPASDRPGPAGDINRDYSTMGRSAVFLPEREPEDLGGESPSGRDKHGDAWFRRFRKFIDDSYLWIGKMFLILLALVVGIGFITDAIINIRNAKHPERPNPIFKTPPDAGTPGADRTCPGGIYKGTASFSFNDNEKFEFLQLLQERPFAQSTTYSKVQTSGELHVRPMPEEFESDIRVDIDIHLSDPNILPLITWAQVRSALVFKSPSHFASDSSSPSPPCINIIAAIWIKPGLSLEDMEIDTQALSIIIHDGLVLDLRNRLLLSSTVGPIRKPPCNSSISLENRETDIGTVSGSISGCWRLYDVLHIYSNSGSINIDVEPQNGSSTRPLPAIMRIGSNSGSVAVSMPLLDSGRGRVREIPDRDYQTRLESNSGSITAQLIHGSSTDLETNSGSIQARVYPCGPNERTTNLKMETVSGSTKATIFSSLTRPKKPLRNLYGDYKTMSGHMSLVYPQEWEGWVTGQTLSGSMSVLWKAIRVIQDGTPGGAWRTLRAIKGYGGETLKFNGISGSLTLDGPSGSGGPDEGKGDSGRDGDDGHDGRRGDGRKGGDGRQWQKHPGEGSPIDTPIPPVGGPTNDQPQRWPGYRDEWGS